MNEEPEQDQSIIPFRVVIGSRTEGNAYPVYAAALGQELEAELELPESILGFAAQLLRPHMALPLEHPERFGQQLGRALFTPKLRGLLLECAREASSEGARLQIQLQIGVPELAALPWEWLALGGTRTWIPALREDYALIRVSRRARPTPPAVVSGPLRVLLIGGPGQNHQLDAIDDILTGAVRAGEIELHILPETDAAELEDLLKRHTFHVLHCAAQVSLTRGESLRLEIGRGMDGFDLEELLAEHPSVRLVILSGVQGEAHDITAAPPLLGAILLSEHLPAAITLSGTLPVTATAHFIAEFYAELVAGAPLDLAVTAGRRALAERSTSSGWGMVQLRMLPGAEQLFVFRSAQRILPSRRLFLPIASIAALIVTLLATMQVFGARSEAARSAEQRTAQVAEQSTQQAFVLPWFPAAPPTPTVWPTQIIPTPLPVPEYYAIYTVVPSDTLELIATRFGSDPGAIAAVNNLNPVLPPRPGRGLVIPAYRDGEQGNSGLVITQGNQNTPKVALTFDIEIDEETLYQILDILRARGLKGTFFVTGRWVMSYPDAARAIVRDGHELGNHSMTHPYFSRISISGAAAELDDTERIVREVTGVTTRPYFRFPYGDSTADMVALLASHGYIAYHWSADDAAISGWIDNAATTPAQAYGGILLMHGRPSTVTELPGWLDRLVAAGLEPTTLSETLR